MSGPPLYPAIEPHATGFLPVGDGHSLYWEECGSPAGRPAVFLHGGPGAGCTTGHRRFFDPAAWRLVLFDQRGCGRSRPHGSLAANTTQNLIGDLERLREARGIGRWLVFGGSWGATLALAYAEAHPERCTALVLRGVFLGTAHEIDWFVNGMGRFFPEAHRSFMAPLGEAERADPVAAYLRRLTGRDAAAREAAARAWAGYETVCSTLLPDAAAQALLEDAATTLALARIEAHYMAHGCFLEDGALLRGVGRIRHLPGAIVQGRYDVVCPPAAAASLAAAWPAAAFTVVPDAGHAASEPGIRAALVQATDRMRDLVPSR